MGADCRNSLGGGGGGRQLCVLSQSAATIGCHAVGYFRSTAAADGDLERPVLVNVQQRERALRGEVPARERALAFALAFCAHQSGCIVWRVGRARCAWIFFM